MEDNKNLSTNAFIATLLAITAFRMPSCMRIATGSLENKYEPHQGSKEKARRLRRLEK